MSEFDHQLWSTFFGGNIIALQLGPYPHARLKAVSRKPASGKRARAQCAQCGYQVPMLRRFLSFGPPICPVDKAAMEPLGDWEEL